MSNYEKYEKAFIDCFGVEKENVSSLKYQDVSAWDSVGHMTLVASLENDFEIMMDTDDIIDFNSFEKGREILKTKYNILI